MTIGRAAAGVHRTLVSPSASSMDVLLISQREGGRVRGPDLDEVQSSPLIFVMNWGRAFQPPSPALASGPERPRRLPQSRWLGRGWTCWAPVEKGAPLYGRQSRQG